MRLPTSPPRARLALLLVQAVAAVVALALLSPPGAADTRAPRIRRKIVFPKGGLFFVRLNAKDNFIPNSTIFAFAYGYRINYPLPSSIRESPYHRRDLHTDVADLLFRHGVDGGACVQRAMCEASQLSAPQGLFQRMLKLLFTAPDRQPERGRGGGGGGGGGGEQPFHEAAAQQCQEAHERCPFSLLFAGGGGFG